MAAQPPAIVQSFDLPTSPFYTQIRKRRAVSPTGSAPANDSSFIDNPRPGENAQHRDKRKRPNLANGFRGLSISTDNLNGNSSASQPFSHNAPEEDEGIGLSHSVGINDVKVEVLPDKPINGNHHHHSNTHHWSIPNRAGPSSASSTTPSTSSDENYDSDFNFAHPSRRFRRHAGVAQQADEIVLPDNVNPSIFNTDLGVEDITVLSPNGRRRREEEEGYRDNLEPAGKRPRNGDMEVDKDMDMADGGPSRRSRKGKTIWHEPEKDRIVITSLSDTSSSHGSSRSPSPEHDLSENQHLSQPGMQGFTLSPSLLTHLLKTQRDQLNQPINPQQQQHSLIVYRPIGLSPNQWPESIVKAWQPDAEYVDSGRFEEIDDVEDIAQHDPAWNFPNEDVLMDVDGDLEMN